VGGGGKWVLCVSGGGAKDCGGRAGGWGREALKSKHLIKGLFIHLSEVKRCAQLLGKDEERGNKTSSICGFDGKLRVIPRVRNEKKWEVTLKLPSSELPGFNGSMGAGKKTANVIKINSIEPVTRDREEQLKVIYSMKKKEPRNFPRINPEARKKDTKLSYKSAKRTGEKKKKKNKQKRKKKDKQPWV